MQVTAIRLRGLSEDERHALAELLATDRLPAADPRVAIAALLESLDPVPFETVLNEPVGPLGNRARQKSEIASARTLLSGVGLAQLVMEVYQQAAAEASQQASAAMSDMFGSESEAAGFILQAVNRYAPAGE